MNYTYEKPYIQFSTLNYKNWTFYKLLTIILFANFRVFDELRKNFVRICIFYIFK